MISNPICFSLRHQLALLIALWACSHGEMMPGALEDVLRWRNSHGAFVQNLSMSPFFSSYYLLFSTSPSLIWDEGSAVGWRGAAWQWSRPHICVTAVPLFPSPKQPPTVLVQLSAHFRVYLKVCRCVSQSSNDGLLQRSLVWVTNGAETSLKTLRNGFIACHLSHCLSVPI